MAPSDVVDRLEAEREVVLRYVGENPNGSVRNIAGITNQERNVVGMMPHPERASDALLGVSEGSTVFRSVMQHAEVLGGGAR